MSLHAELSPDALDRLKKQRRNSTITSLSIAVLSLVLVGLILGILLLPDVIQETPQIVTYETPVPEETDDDVKKPQAKADRTPAAPASSMAMVVAANTAAPTSVPVPDVEATNPSLDFGMDNDFGDGWGSQGMGDGGGFGGGGGFGSGNPGSGGLKGLMYDFKQDRDGKPTKYNIANARDFVDNVLRIQQDRFSEGSLARYFRAPNYLYLTHLAIPFSNAVDGPSFFGAKEKIKPSGWIAAYHGTVTVPKTGTYRFSGMGDDYLVVMVDGRTNLVACWHDIQNSIAGSWKPTPPTGSFMSPYLTRLVYGDWINLNAGQKIKMDVAIGERPGGKVGFILHIEEKGVEYRKAPDGRPILPLFTTARLKQDEISRLRGEFKNYEIEWEKVPVFSKR
jgi:hypothetical protein